MEEKELREYLLGLKRYDIDTVVDGILDKIKENSSINLLRLRINGIDGIVTNNFKHAKKKYKNWNCIWVEKEEGKWKVN